MLGVNWRDNLWPPATRLRIERNKLKGLCHGSPVRFV